jgi:hypothetical protein
VIGEDGAPMTGRGSVFVSARRMGVGTIDYGQFMVETPGDGTFRAKLPPGDYEIEARTGSDPTGVGADERLGTLDVSVNGTPVSNLTVQLGRGATMTGRFVFEGVGSPPERASACGTVTASFSALPGGRCRRGNGQSASGGMPVATAPDWRFRIDGLFGTCVISFLPVNLGSWSVVGFYYGEVDLLDRPITYQPGQLVSGFRVVLSIAGRNWGCEYQMNGASRRVSTWPWSFPSILSGGRSPHDSCAPFCHRRHRRPPGPEVR